jgi:hypothetical protein
MPSLATDNTTSRLVFRTPQQRLLWSLIEYDVQEPLTSNGGRARAITATQ